MAAQHRGGPPDDARLFGPGALATLRAAAEEVSYLLGRGYAMDAAVAAVGNHHALAQRQRVALRRSCCDGARRADRRARALAPEAVAGRVLRVDGFNLVVTLEVALGGGVVLLGGDGCARDLAGLRGSYHLVGDTDVALEHAYAVLGELGVGAVEWYLDAPVSNSGRLRERVLVHGARAGVVTRAELVPDPDRVLVGSERVASADAAVLDRCGSWVNLAAWTIARRVPGAWVVDLGVPWGG